ncbi:MAG: polysaccharide deacetylase family protein [Robiginitomaculum sp.]|nr:polysaccharide deacetylase family protein [Robiginitomaculum sp.]
MNAPYLPDLSLKGKIRRRLTRLASRKLLPTIDQKYISFSFDDFPKSSAIAGAQSLEDKGLHGTFYACTGQFGQSNHFGELCSSDDIERLFAAGHEIGCHTQNHIDCAVSPPAVVQMEIQRNRAVLSALGISNADTFAFPYGDVSFTSKKALADKFATLRGVQPGINRKGSDANQLLAVPIEGDIDNLQYIKNFFEQLDAKNGWLIFYSHDVRAKFSRWGCSPALLRAVINEAIARNYIIAPVTSIYSQIQERQIK